MRVREINGNVEITLELSIEEFDVLREYYLKFEGITDVDRVREPKFTIPSGGQYLPKSTMESYSQIIEELSKKIFTYAKENRIKFVR